ncbi:hypothetical protein AB1N83_013182 [Pleurotus pulmonarius]
MHHTSRPLISRSSSNRPASEPNAVTRTRQAAAWSNPERKPRKELTLAHSPNCFPAYLMSDSRANGTHRLSTQAPAKKLSTVTSKQHIMNGTKRKRKERSGAQTQGGAGPEDGVGAHVWATAGRCGQCCRDLGTQHQGEGRTRAVLGARIYGSSLSLTSILKPRAMSTQSNEEKKKNEDEDVPRL